MASGGEQQAWRGSRPASISRPPPAQAQSQARATNNSSSHPASQKASTPAKQDPAKPRDSVKSPEPAAQKADSTTQKQPPAASGNIWEQRRNAAEKAKTAVQTPRDGQKDGPKDGQKDGKPRAADEKAAPASSETKSVPEEKHIPVNDFNSEEVKQMLASKAVPKMKPYKPSDSAAKAKPWGAKAGNMENGQSFPVQLGKQITALQSKR